MICPGRFDDFGFNLTEILGNFSHIAHHAKPWESRVRSLKAKEAPVQRLFLASKLFNSPHLLIMCQRKIHVFSNFTMRLHGPRSPRTFVIFSNDFRDRFFEIMCRKACLKGMACAKQKRLLESNAIAPFFF